MIKIFSHFIPKVVSLLFITELLLLVVALYFAGTVSLAAPGGYFALEIPNFWPAAIVYALILSFCMAAFGMYQLHSRQSMRASLYRLFPAFAVGISTVALAYYMLPKLYLGQGILVLAILVSIASVLFIRLMVLHLSKSRLKKSRVIFLGDSALTKQCIELAKTNSLYGDYDVVRIMPLLNVDNANDATTELSNTPSLISIASKYNVDEIVISVKNWRGVNIPIQQLLECKLRGIAVTTIAHFFEREANQIKINYLQPSWLIFGEGFNQSWLRSFGKRSVDVVASTLLLVLTFPVMGLATLCILLEDGSPVLYRQERVGKNGKTFMVLKFRSMRTDAEKSGNPQWAQVGDNRVTKVGRFIRKTRIDELPQIFNVLKGEMSFVGPRPERPYFVKQLIEQVPFYDMRHSIKPGLTGFAQVRYQYGATVEDAIEKLQYDLYYVKNHGFFLDLLIIIDTIQVVLFAKGSR